jgi:hypothetical protein
MRRKLVFLFVPLAALAACDVVTSRFDTWEDAEASQLVERGWLPGILPHSATDLVVRNDLDLNTSQGNFSFDPEDYETFRESIISPYAPSTELMNAVGSEYEIHSGRGYPVLFHVESESQWVFLCMPEQGVCRYHMVSTLSPTQ